MATIREIVQEVFEAVGGLRSSPLGAPPKGLGAVELAETLRTKPLGPRSEVADRIFGQWEAEDASKSSSLQIVSGDGQSVPAGSPVKPVTVKVLDSRGQPAVGIPVFFVVTGGNGSVTKSRQVTDAKGTATAGTWTLGAVPGTNTLLARSSTGAETKITATGTGSGPTIP